MNLIQFGQTSQIMAHIEYRKMDILEMKDPMLFQFQVQQLLQNIGIMMVMKIVYLKINTLGLRLAGNE